jgi:catechol 2,3-dioxygenase-like lactoylglutathione lyase family enzyme
MSHAAIFVLDQQEALEFYRDKLGFEVRTDATMDGGFRWLTVGPKDQPGFELILMEPNPGFMFDEATANLLAMLEPIMICFLGVIIGGIVISMYMPMFDLINKIN